MNKLKKTTVILVLVLLISLSFAYASEHKKISSNALKAQSKGFNAKISVSPNKDIYTVGSPINFKSSGSKFNASSTIYYEWLFGGDGRSNEENTKFAFQSPGNYKVIFKAIEPVPNLVYEDFVIIKVRKPNKAPIVNADVTPKQVFVQQDVTFTAEGTKDPDGDTLLYSWKIDGVEVSTEETYVHKFPKWKLDPYKVTLEVTDTPDGSIYTAGTTVLKDFNVNVKNRAPVIIASIMNNNEILADSDEVNVGDVLKLYLEESYDPDGDDITFEIDFDQGEEFFEVEDGFTFQYFDVNENFNEQIYYPKLRIFDGELTSLKTFTLKVLNTRPIPEAIITPEEIFRGDTITLDGSPSFDPDFPDEELPYFEWVIGGGASVFEKVTTTSFNEVGLFTASLIVKDKNNAQNLISYSIEIKNKKPIAEFIAPTEVFTNEPVKFTSTSSDPEKDTLTYHWDFGDGKTSSEVSPTHIYENNPETGNKYTVKLTLTDEHGGSSSKTYDIIVKNTKPEVSFTYPEKIHAMQEIELISTSTDSDGQIIEYLWDFGEGYRTGSEKQKFTFQEQKNYDIKLKVIDDDEEFSEKSVTIPVLKRLNQLPVPLLGKDQVIRLGTSVFLSGVNSYDLDGEEITFEWNFGDGSVKSTQESVTHYYLVPQEYTVTLTVNDGKDSASASIKINVVDGLIPQNVGGEYIWDVYDGEVQGTCFSSCPKLGDSCNKPDDKKKLMNGQKLICRQEIKRQTIIDNKWVLIAANEDINIREKFVNCGTVNVMVLKDGQIVPLEGNVISAGQAFWIKTTSKCEYLTSSSQPVNNLEDGWHLLPINSVFDINGIVDGLCETSVSKIFASYSGTDNILSFEDGIDLLDPKNRLTSYLEIGVHVLCGLTPEEKIRREKLSKLIKENGYVVDKENGLTWTVAKEEKSCHFRDELNSCSSEHVQYCSRLSLGLFNQWKVPKEEQLSNLINIERIDSSLLDFEEGDQVWTDKYKRRTKRVKFRNWRTLYLNDYYKYDSATDQLILVTSNSLNPAQTICVMENSMTEKEFYLQKIKLNEDNSVILSEHMDKMFTRPSSELNCDYSNIEPCSGQLQTHCQNLVQGGFTDWRVPSPEEIEHLLEINGYENSYFNIQDKAKNVCVRDGLDLDDGVRQHLFTINEQVAKDSINNLQWVMDIKEKHHDDSHTYCDDLNFGDFSDWRLPSQNEVKMLEKYYYVNNELFSSLKDLSNLWLSDSWAQTQGGTRYITRYFQYLPLSIKYDGRRSTRNISCVREPTTYSISTEASEGGTITPPNIQVDEGSSQNVDVSADSGFVIETLEVNQVPVTIEPAERTYTHNIAAIKSNKNVKASFKRRGKGVQIVSNGNMGGVPVYSTISSSSQLTSDGYKYKNPQLTKPNGDFSLPGTYYIAETQDETQTMASYWESSHAFCRVKGHEKALSFNSGLDCKDDQKMFYFIGQSKWAKAGEEKCFGEILCDSTLSTTVSPSVQQVDASICERIAINPTVPTLYNDKPHIAVTGRITETVDQFCKDLGYAKADSWEGGLDCSSLDRKYYFGGISWPTAGETECVSKIVCSEETVPAPHITGSEDHFNEEECINAFSTTVSPSVQGTVKEGGEYFVFGDVEVKDGYVEAKLDRFNIVIVPQPGYKAEIFVDDVKFSKENPIFRNADNFIFLDQDIDVNSFVPLFNMQDINKFSIQFVPKYDNIEYQSCQDEDSSDYTKKSTLTYSYSKSGGNIESTISDTCLHINGKDYLRENVCDGNVPKVKLEECNVCSNGACVETVPVKLVKGWNLLGANKNLPMSTFDSCGNFKINMFDGNWYSYKPSGYDNSRYTSKFGTTIPQGQGFWLLAENECIVNLPITNDYTYSKKGSGWQLISVAMLLDDDLKTFSKEVCTNGMKKSWVYNAELELNAGSERQEGWDKIFLNEDSNNYEKIRSYLGAWVFCN